LVSHRREGGGGGKEGKTGPRSKKNRGVSSLIKKKPNKGGGGKKAKKMVFCFPDRGQGGKGNARTRPLRLEKKANQEKKKSGAAGILAMS